MSTLLERLKEFADPGRRGSIAAFARKTGIKDSTVRGWFRFGVKKLSYEVTMAICYAYNLNEQWLTHGTGFKYHDQIDESQIRYLTPELKSNSRKIPLLSHTQAGSLGTSIAWQDSHEIGGALDFIEYYGERPLSASSYALTIEGDSMEPILVKGDYVFVDPEIMPENNNIVVVRFEKTGDVLTKRYKKVDDNTVLFISENSKYEPIVCTPESNGAVILGVVVELKRRFI